MKKYFILILSIFFLYSFKPYDCSGDKGGVCSINYKEVVKSEVGKVKGKILCKKYDLKMSQNCQKVLFTEDDKIYEFCSCSKKNKEIEEFAGKEVEIYGKICTMKDGTTQIHSESIKIL